MSAGEAELRRYLAGEHLDVTDAMRSLPPTVDPALVIGVVEKVIDRRRWVAKLCNKLPPRAIRGLLAASLDHPNHLFLQLAVAPVVDDTELLRSWSHALEAMIDLDASYNWGSAPLKAKIAKLVADKPILAAIQGTVAHSENAPLIMLAVLVADGSDASYDALVRHIDTAFTARDRRLDLLKRLKTHAVKTPALDALFVDLDGALQQRNDDSPALHLGPMIGVGKVAVLWFDVRLSSTRKTTSNVPWIQGSVEVDSRSESWFRVWAATVNPVVSSDDRHTSFSSSGVQDDTLELGPCMPAEYPAWLAKTAAKLKIEWEPFSPRSNLRGKKRDRIAAWLAGR